MGGVPVESLFQKSDGHKVAIFKSVTDGATSGLVATDVQAAIKREMPSVNLTVYNLSHDGSKKDRDGHPLVGAKLYPCEGCFAGGGRVCLNLCDRNMVDSDIYKPDDQGVNIYETINRASLVYIACEARFGGVDSFTQRFLERLAVYRNAYERRQRNVLVDKVLITTVTGGGASVVVGGLVAMMSNLGFATPPQGTLAIDVDDTVERDVAVAQYKRHAPVRESLEQMVENGIRLTRKLGRD